MKWSLRIGRILGVDVYIHFTFILLLAFIGLGIWAQDRNIGAAMYGVLFFLALFACVLLHEFGHALTARRYGIQTHDITLLPIGGLARLERMPDRPIQELWVALAGPAVNVVIAAGLFSGLVLTGQWTGLQGLSAMEGNLASRLLVINIILVLFNMLPAFPMDGGRVLRSLLAMRMDYARATNIAATIGQGMAILFGFVGLFANPILLFIALFVWIGASQEAAAAEVKVSLGDARVRDAMLTEFRVLAPENTLADAARMLLAGSQQDFPIISHGQLVGLVPRSALLKGLKESGETAPIQVVMVQDIETLDPDEMLDTALSRGGKDRPGTMPVIRGGQIVGLITPENIGEYFMIRSALAKRGGNPPPLRREGMRAPPVIATSTSPRW
jgi:Zn-dependent protease